MACCSRSTLLLLLLQLLVMERYDEAFAHRGIVETQLAQYLGLIFAFYTSLQTLLSFHPSRHAPHAPLSHSIGA